MTTRSMARSRPATGVARTLCPGDWLAPIATWPRRLLLLMLLCVLPVGCDQGARSLALDQPKARESLKAFLEAWKTRTN